MEERCFKFNDYLQPDYGSVGNFLLLLLLLLRLNHPKHKGIRVFGFLNIIRYLNIPDIITPCINRQVYTYTV